MHKSILSSTLISLNNSKIQCTQCTMTILCPSISDLLDERHFAWNAIERVGSNEIQQLHDPVSGTITMGIVQIEERLS